MTVEEYFDGTEYVVLVDAALSVLEIIVDVIGGISDTSCPAEPNLDPSVGGSRGSSP